MKAQLVNCHVNCPKRMLHFFNEGREKINELNRLYIPPGYLHSSIKNFKSVP